MTPLMRLLKNIRYIDVSASPQDIVYVCNFSHLNILSNTLEVDIHDLTQSPGRVLLWPSTQKDHVVVSVYMNEPTSQTVYDQESGRHLLTTLFLHERVLNYFRKGIIEKAKKLLAKMDMQIFKGVRRASMKEYVRLESMIHDAEDAQ